MPSLAHTEPAFLVSAAQGLAAFMALGRISPDLIHIHKADTLLLLHANERLEPVLGYGLAALNALDGGLLSLLPDPVQRRRVRAFARMARALPAGYARTHQIELRHRNGSPLHLETRMTLLAGEHGQLLVCLTRDATAEHDSREQARQQKALLSEAETVFEYGSWEYDYATGRSYCSENLFRLLQWPNRDGDELGRRFLDHVHPDDRPLVLQAMQSTEEKGTPYRVEYRYLPPGRETYIVLRAVGKVRRGADGSLLKLFGNATDVTVSRRTEQKIKRVETLLADTERLMKHGSWEWDAATGEIFWSGGIYRIFDRDPSLPPLTDEEYKALLPPAERSRVTALSATALQAGQPFAYKTWIELPGGVRKWLSVRMQPVFDAAGTLASLLGSTTDITAEHDKAEKQELMQNLLSDSEEQFGHGSWVWHADTGQVIWSRGMWMLLGCGPEAFTGRPQPSEWYYDYVHPDDAETLRAATRQMLATGQYPATYHRIITVQGQVKTVLARGKIHEGSPVRIIGSVSDVTEERAMVQKLTENEQFLSETEKIFHYGSWRYYIGSGTAHWSEGLFKMFGYEPHEFDGEPLPRDMYMRHVHPEDREVLDRHVQAVLASGAEVFEDPYHRIVTRHGEVKIVKSRGKLMDAGQPNAYIIGSTIDFTHLKQLESELELKVQELEASNAELEQFAYVASHDLQEPLRKVRAFSSLLLKEQADVLTGNSRAYLDRMISATGRMQQLITDLLAFSRTGRMQADPEAVDLNALLAQLLLDMEFRIQEQQAQVDIGPMPVVRALPTQMQQLFQNLLGNALKFSKPGLPPRITVRSRPLALAEKQQHGLPELASHSAITISDNGIGFEPEYAEKIFVIFQRLHGRQEYEGTGIGLAICRRIVDNHQGRIWAQGRPGQGATFTLILPDHD